MNSELSSVLVMLVFAVLGWLAFRKSAAPRKWWIWLLLLTATLLAGQVGVDSRIISISGFEVYLNDCLQGLGFGVLAGLLIRNK